jgi:hypothetical protein
MHVVSSQYRHIRHRPPPQHQILKNIFLIIILFKLPSKVLEKSTVICETQEVFMGGVVDVSGLFEKFIFTGYNL